MTNVLATLAKSVLIPLGLTATLSATGRAIKKKIYESGMTTLIISNKKMKDIIKKVKSPEESGLLMKVFSETIENEVKDQKDRFIGPILGIFAASLLGNRLAGKGVIWSGEGTFRADQNF